MTIENVRIRANEYMLNSFKFQAMADSGKFWPDAVRGLECRAENNAEMAAQMFETKRLMETEGVEYALASVDAYWGFSAFLDERAAREGVLK